MTEKILAERYRLVEQIGIGGMAIVYRAVDIRTGHDVAVKVLKPEFNQNAEFVSRFQREAEAASKMTHHNIVNLLDVGMDGENRYLVMEYVRGKTLKQVIQEKGRLSPQVAAQITIRILSALQHAHQHGIIHRDIKPQNILVHEDGHIKVADFGIARITGASTLTRDDSVMGTVHYISPEQVSGHEVSTRSDIYSTGVVLYEMLTGKVPYDGENYVTIAMQHLHAQPTPIETLAPDVPPAIIHVCMMAMEKDPRYRYQSAIEMATELRMALDGRTDQMQPRWAEVPQQVPTGAVPVPVQQPQQQTGPNPRRKPVRREETRQQRMVRIVSVVMITIFVFYGLIYGSIKIAELVMTRAEVPDVVGMTAEEAVRAMELKELTNETVEMYDPNIAAGMIISQAPEAGKRIRKGDTVVLTVSKGPSAQTVPSVVGRTTEDAIKVLQTPGLTLSVTERKVSSDTAIGVILTQAPEAGTQSQPGDIVEVTVSGGSAYVPNVVGKTLDAAQELVESASLTLGGDIEWEETSDPEKHGLVASQYPAPDTQVILGTEVSLTLYRVPTLIHTAIITLSLPESTEAISVRVTVMEGEEEKTVWATTSYSPDLPRRPSLEIYADAPGQYTYRVYTNDQYLYQMPVELE